MKALHGNSHGKDSQELRVASNMAVQHAWKLFIKIGTHAHVSPLYPSKIQRFHIYVGNVPNIPARAISNDGTDREPEPNTRVHIDWKTTPEPSLSLVSSFVSPYSIPDVPGSPATAIADRIRQGE